MKKRIAFYILVFMCLLVNFNIVYATPAILSESAVLIDASSGTILAQKNADKNVSGKFNQDYDGNPRHRIRRVN